MYFKCTELFSNKKNEILNRNKMKAKKLVYLRFAVEMPYLMAYKKIPNPFTFHIIVV